MNSKTKAIAIAIRKAPLTLHNKEEIEGLVSRLEAAPASVAEALHQEEKGHCKAQDWDKATKIQNLRNRIYTLCG